MFCGIRALAYVLIGSAWQTRRSAILSFLFFFFASRCLPLFRASTLNETFDELVFKSIQIEKDIALDVL